MKNAILASVAAIGLATFSARSGTVAYWPLAFENGVRTTTANVFANQGDGGTLDAVPSSRSGASWVAGDAYCPLGTNAFPVGYGVWDPVSGTNAVADSALYFHKTSLAGYAGALRVANPAALRLSTFTIECFIRMQQGTGQGDWNCIAVMPQQIANCANYESWGLRVTGAETIKARFSKDKGTVSANLGGTDNTEIGSNGNAPAIYDGGWHHVALVVDGSTLKATLFVDYIQRGTGTLPEAVAYKSGMDLFIGNTPQTTGPFGGSIAHFRVSDAALSPSEFLHFKSMTPAAEEDPDTVLHVTFEPVAGISTPRAFFNDAANGSALDCLVANYYPQGAADVPFTPVFANLLDATGAASAKSLLNATQTTGGKTVPTCLQWQPEEDVFSNGTFTVECFYKTSKTLGSWIPLVRRLGGYNVQFNLGFSGGANAGKLTAASVPGDTGASVSIVDSVRSDDGQWHHAALVVNRGRGTIALFRDYEQVGSADYTRVCAPTDKPVCIGGSYSNDGVFYTFDGAIDDVRITMRALTIGEFLRRDNLVPAGSTVAWAAFDNALAADAPAFALTNGTAAAVGDGGAVPTFVSLGSGERIEDAAGNSLRAPNLAALSFEQGVVKYPGNVLLPLLDEQTVEFFVKAGPQTPFAGLLRCNLYRDVADIPVWGLSFDEHDGTKLRVRCTTVSAASWNNAGINEDTPVVVGDGRRHHIALTLSTTGQGASASTTVSIYKDYEETPSWKKTVSGRLFYGGGYAPVWIGASSSATAFFDGEIDELRISRGILAPSDFLRRGKLPFILVVR